MHHLTRALVSTTRPERGATAVEYGLMIALIAMAIFGGIYLLGPQPRCHLRRGRGVTLS